MKNSTRIGSILGTWTAKSETKASIGFYDLLTYLTIHFMPDPMSKNGCQNSCNELDNEFCKVSLEPNNKQCTNATDTIYDWSEIAAFINFGFHIEAGFPYYIHINQTTGGWIGPFNLVLAQNDTVILDDSNSLIDQYVTRYIQTITTPFVKNNVDNTLYPELLTFDKTLGHRAVNHTLHEQVVMENVDDPYAKYAGTCNNGDVQPILPLLKFGFINATKQKPIIQMNYKLLTTPMHNETLYGLMPSLKKRFNDPNNGFSISGPYCYEKDASRGYTFDFVYDSSNPTNDLIFVHGCVKGFPCLPPAASMQSSSITFYNQTLIGGVEVIDVTKAFLFFICWVLSMSLIVSATCNYRQAKQLRQQQQQQYHQGQNGFALSTTASSATTPATLSKSTITTTNNQSQDATNNAEQNPFGDLGEGESITQPLLQSSETYEANEPAASTEIPPQGETV